MTKDERKARGENVRSRPGQAALDTAGGGIHDNGFDTVARKKADETRRQTCSTLSNLFLRTDGWLRAVPTEDGKSIYFKWKFTRGKWAGHYVMTLVEVWQWDYGLALLLDKCEAVDIGVRRPTKDTAFDHGDGAAYVIHTKQK